EALSTISRSACQDSTDTLASRRRLQRQGIPENLVPAALKQLSHFVLEKLADLKRLAKW
ncbi:hypothetical protein MTO96_042528, partial [Rhipicephalus appendiculatus]